MTNTITIPIQELAVKVKELCADGNELVQMTIFDRDGPLPPCVAFVAWRRGAHHDTDYEEIEENFLEGAQADED